MSIRYEVVENLITTPASYKARTRKRSSVGLNELLNVIARTSALSRSDVKAVVMTLTQQIKTELLMGNQVSINGLCLFSTSISGKLETPTSPLPEDAVVNITTRVCPSFNKAIHTNARLHRTVPIDQSPLLTTLTPITGTLNPLAGRQVLQFEGDRMKFNLDASDEGVFMVRIADNFSTRITTYLRAGEKLLQFALPKAVIQGFPTRLEVRARRPNSQQLRTTPWPYNLNVL